MREYHLMEAAYGTNDKFNDGNVKFISERRAFTLVSAVQDDLYLVVMIFLDGRVLISSVNTPEVMTRIKSSFGQLLNPVNMNKAFGHYDLVTDMLKAIIKKFYSRFESLRFIASDKAVLNKLERYLKKPEVKQFLVSKRYEYVEHEQDKKLILIRFNKE